MADTLQAHTPVILLILDGWGHTETTFYNAIHSANKPNWDQYWDNYPHALISASGIDVGLPAEQMGNSEVGHMNIGAGRLVAQEYTRINNAIRDGSFFENNVLRKAFDKAASTNKAVHLMGLLSPGGVHSHEEHLFALMDMADQSDVEKIYIHAFLDGRDTPQKSALESIHRTQSKISEVGKGQIVSMIGRHYAMDRNKHWERTQIAYDLITTGKAEFSSTDPYIALDMAYARGETDEFVQATRITPRNDEPIVVEDGDVMIFANYRADRARQLARALTKPAFKSFERKYVPTLASFVSLTMYKANYEFPVAFKPELLENGFGEYISTIGLKQLRIAETEKYAHVTFFFNGGKEHVFDGEDRVLVPSPHVRTYDEQPEMAAREVTEKLVEAIKSKKYDAIICNYANTDMVGHTGNFDAAIKAVETIDECIGQVVSAAQASGAEVLITADHGNAEQMRTYQTEKIKSQPHTAHTNNLVPLIYIGRNANISHNEGCLSDLAPTMLEIMNISVPEEMTGTTLFSVTSETEKTN